MFYFMLFINDVPQNSWRVTASITSTPKINFSGAPKKALIVLEDRSYQT